MEDRCLEFELCLYLAPPAVQLPDEDSRSRAKDHLRWLQRLEEVLRRVVGSEARVWLCSSIAALPVPSRVQSSVFMSFIRDAARFSSSQAKRVDAAKETDDHGDLLVKQIVRMLCDGCPRQVGRLLAKDDKLLRRFFSGHTKRILGWFQNFAGAGETDHRLGARALARYAFLHRDDYWHELEWKGKHSQAPATVASKPHYFSELDVLRTVNNFLEHVPSFWKSAELRDSLEEGEYLSLDPDFFHVELLERLTSDKSDEVWLLIEDYLRSESFAVLCQRTLYMMNDKFLLAFLSNLGAAFGKFRKDAMRGGEQGSIYESQGVFNVGKSFKDIPWLETTFLMGLEWETLYDAAFTNACASHGREMLRLVQDEEHEEDARTLISLLSEGLLCETEHWRLMQECLHVDKCEAVKRLSMESWLLFYRICERSNSAGSLERLMTEVGTGFIRTKPTAAEGYELLRPNKERKKSEKRKRRRPRRRARKRAQHSEDDDSESDSDQVNEADNNRCALSWRLSLDNYTVTWTAVDVAEHLVNYALRRWLHWVAVRW